MKILDGYERIMTRSETNEMRMKSLRNILPRGSEIAVILDDREDVWRESITNLLPVAPYYFFKGVGARDGLRSSAEDFICS